MQGISRCPRSPYPSHSGAAPSSTTTAPTLAARADQSLAGLAPGYFARVMVTGIVSVGVRTAGADGAALVMLVLGVLIAAVLAVLYIARWIRHRDRMRRDAKSPESAFGYFTVVAACSVLAVGLQAEGFGTVSVVLLGIGAAIWIGLGYGLPWQVLMTRDGEPILARSNGSWFVRSVASGPGRGPAAVLG
nr:hypothetical protein [Brachybacterium sp. FME24]